MVYTFGLFPITHFSVFEKYFEDEAVANDDTSDFTLLFVLYFEDVCNNFIRSLTSFVKVIIRRHIANRRFDHPRWHSLIAHSLFLAASSGVNSTFQTRRDEDGDVSRNKKRIYIFFLVFKFRYSRRLLGTRRGRRATKHSGGELFDSVCTIHSCKIQCLDASSENVSTA